MELTWRLVLAVALLCCQSDANVSCKNEIGGVVDWYILYKLPGSYTSFYMDPNGNKMISDIRHQGGALARTLQPYFDQTGNIGYIVYNDQPPTCSAKDEFGHSKGLLLMDTVSGVWLLHSTPSFPYGRASNNFYPDSGRVNAQTFICANFNYMELKKIGSHLQYINAHVFDTFLPNNMDQDFREAANRVRVPPDPNTQTQLYHDLTSVGGVSFKSFFKKTLDFVTIQEYEEGDLYLTIANNIGSNVRAQTFKQAGSCESYCPTDGRHVHNVEKVKISTSEWERGTDHSKWCVTEDYDWTCFGDSNRAVKQYERRGGALCIKDATVNTKFKSFIKKLEDCSVPPKKCPRFLTSE